MVTQTHWKMVTLFEKTEPSKRIHGKHRFSGKVTYACLYARPFLVLVSDITQEHAPTRKPKSTSADLYIYMHIQSNIWRVRIHPSAFVTLADQ